MGRRESAAKCGAALVVAIFIAGCGSNGSDSTTVGLGECGREVSAVPIVGKRLSDDRSSIRVAYTRDDPCQFAVAEHKGDLYFSLLSTGDRMITGGATVGCVDIPLDPPISAEAHVYPVGTGPAPDAATVAGALADGSDCLHVPEGEPNFVID